MHKVLFGLVLVLVATTSFAQYEVSAGLGTLLTNTTGNAFQFESKFESNFNLQFRYNYNNNTAFSLTFNKDSFKFGKWLYNHNFVKHSEVFNYQYFKIAPTLEYYFNKNLFVLLGLPVFSSSNKGIKTKVGLEAGLGIKYFLTKHWGLQTETKYCYVKDFIVPVANVVFWDFSIVYRF